MNTAVVILIASWYSLASLVSEGTYVKTKGVMANGKAFSDTALTCATGLYPLGTQLEVRNPRTGRKVIVEVTDRISRRFSKTRIDLSKRAFSEIADLKQGVVQVEIREVGDGRKRDSSKNF